MHSHEEFTQKHKLRVFVGTWNVNGGKHFRSVAHKHESVTDWLLDLAKTINPEANWGYRNPTYDGDQLNRPIDMFAIGFEEIVDLTTSNIVAGSKPSANQREWGLFLQHHLNRDAHERDTYVGATSVCFVCSHFAAGQSAVRERNDDFHEICRRLVFPSGRTILSHDYVFWCGDFNYRINLSGPEVKRLVAQSAWSDLLRSDQLTLERQAGNVFRGFDEGLIRFAPTYKYDLFCDDYDTSEKARSPAWTDRVLWRRVRLQFPVTDPDGLFVMPSTDAIDETWSPGQLVLYNRSELKTSDHRPVAAVFDIDVCSVSRNARRKIVLKCIEDYGSIDAMVELTMQLVEAVSQQPVPNDSSHTALYRWRDFIDKLKVIAGLKRGVVLLYQFTEPNTILLTYANPIQASAAATFMNGYVTPWSSPVGSSNIEGGYEIHFSARLYSPYNNSRTNTVSDDSMTELEKTGRSMWYETMQRLVEIAERDDAAAHGPAITADVYPAILLAAAPTRQAPPRPAPPPRRPPPPSSISSGTITTSSDSTAASYRLPQEFTKFSLSEDPGTIPAVEHVNEPRRHAQYYSQSATASPVHVASVSNSIQSPVNTVMSTDSCGGLLLPNPIEMQTVTSCLDLLQDGNEQLLILNDSINRPASSTDLCTLGFNALNKPKPVAYVEPNPTVCSAPLPLNSQAQAPVPPPIPRRPAPPPPTSHPPLLPSNTESKPSDDLQLYVNHCHSLFNTFSVHNTMWHHVTHS
ncbi:unnamed protein product [Echinostoma caproni]|uniref:IPPc domain-containing protein n=1 Tax=Echinostoma caproni TaxID=27848 RepID=A0A183ADD8_9TREM|nr:unnamed protein product [Echinostoma caproni]